MRALSALVAVLIALSVAPSRAAAQCTPPHLEVSLPADGASGVPIDPLFFRARYAPTAIYRGEPVTLARAGEMAREIPTTFEDVESTLVATPDEPLAPSTSYTLRWPALGDDDAAVIGEGRDVAFTTGTEVAPAAPTFEGIAAIDWDAEKARDDCVGSSIERYVFDLRVGAWSDGAGSGTLDALVFLSESPGRDPSEGPLLVATAALPAPDETVVVRLPRDESIGHVCFTAVARDVTGFFSTASPVSCVDTDRPPFFGGCSAGGGGSAALGLPIVLALAWLSRRRDR